MAGIDDVRLKVITIKLGGAAWLRPLARLVQSYRFIDLTHLTKLNTYRKSPCGPKYIR